MKVRFLVVGKTAFEDLKIGELRYEQRLVHYCTFERLELPDVKNPKALSQVQIKEKEGEAILSKLKATDYVVLLDENGKSFSSVNFANWLSQKQMQHTGTLVFIIGGAFGFSSEVYERAQFKLSLSEMTFSHQMVRMIFLEQLYRAFSILKGEPYHHA
ncbi:MAG: 23S rRNA (pseudouridine(1915)-N(3))-methyltransferase RlmH [Sphingomonadales bacterium]|nr:23S rRNA (pseudouridine(1915)-N(3))-methyltransferase RlmH [Sphingomonadales bacterium]